MKQIKTPIIDVKKYGGKQIAVANGKIVAVGKTSQEVINLTKKHMPSKPLNEISIFSVPKTLNVIYYV